jgi:hypothetical protein
MNLPCGVLPATAREPPGTAMLAAELAELAERDGDCSSSSRPLDNRKRMFNTWAADPRLGIEASRHRVLTNKTQPPNCGDVLPALIVPLRPLR